MRRLLNRVHQLLYARGTGASSTRDRFPAVVAELDHQLDEWRDVLPAAFRFTVDGSRGVSAGGGVGAATGLEAEASGFLRQRYLTCRSVIYRPYLMWMLSGNGGDEGDGGGSGGGGLNSSARQPGAEMLEGCRLCLESCLLHVLNLRGFAQTVLVDTWICSLS